MLFMHKDGLWNWTGIIMFIIGGVILFLGSIECFKKFKYKTVLYFGSVIFVFSPVLMRLCEATIPTKPENSDGLVLFFQCVYVLFALLLVISAGQGFFSESETFGKTENKEEKRNIQDIGTRNRAVPKNKALQKRQIVADKTALERNREEARRISWNNDLLNLSETSKEFTVYFHENEDLYDCDRDKLFVKVRFLDRPGTFVYIYGYYWVSMGEHVSVPKGKKETDIGYVVGWFVAKMSEMNRPEREYLEVNSVLPSEKMQKLVNALTPEEQHEMIANIRRATEEEKWMRSCYLFDYDFLKKDERWIFK